MTIAVCVLGMHRSGTSMAAKLLHDNGLVMGLPPQKGPADNPLGFYEHNELVKLNDLLLKDFGGSYDRPPHIDFGRIGEKRRLAADAMIGELSGPGRPWGWKDPRNCLTLPFWLERLAGRDVRLVHCVRHPAAVAASLLARQRMPPSQSHALWLRYNRDVLRYCAGLPRLVVDYDVLLSDESAVRRFLEHCGLEPADLSALRPGLRHHGPEDAGVPAKAVLLYRQLTQPE